MGKEVVLFESETPKSRQEVAAFLRELAAKIDGGEVTFQQGAESVSVTMPPNVVLELKVEEEAKKNKTKRSLEVEIEWYLGDASEDVRLV